MQCFGRGKRKQHACSKLHIYTLCMYNVSVNFLCHYNIYHNCGRIQGRRSFSPRIQPAMGLACQVVPARHGCMQPRRAGTTLARKALSWLNSGTETAASVPKGYNSMHYCMTSAQYKEYLRRLQDRSPAYRQTPIFRHPFFRKQCFSLKYVLVTPPQNFWRYV